MFGHYDFRVATVNLFFIVKWETVGCCNIALESTNNKVLIRKKFFSEITKYALNSFSLRAFQKCCQFLREDIVVRQLKRASEMFVVVWHTGHHIPME